jgi:hypothetical protein
MEFFQRNYILSLALINEIFVITDFILTVFDIIIYARILL